MTNDSLCDAYRTGCKAEVEVKLDKLRVEIKHNKEVMDERKDFLDKAMNIASEALDRRLTAENGIRDELTKQSNTFITRREFYTIMTLLTAIMAVALTFLIYIRV